MENWGRDKGAVQTNCMCRFWPSTRYDEGRRPERKTGKSRMAILGLARLNLAMY